jgi:fatty acid-binding protein DegV
VRVAVITDSAASLAPDLAADHQVTVVPLHLDGITTAAPSPGEFLDAAARAGSDEAVVLTVASRVSGVWNAARIASASASMPMSVVDTETAAGAQALVVLAAAEAAASGAPRPAVEAAARDAIDRVRLVAVVDGLDYLVRSGRVPGIAGWAGRMLGLQPLFEFRRVRLDGCVRQRAGRPRWRGSSATGGAVAPGPRPVPGSMSPACTRRRSLMPKR